MELFAKIVTVKIEEKTETNNQKSIKSTVNMAATLTFEHMEITPMLLLAQEVFVKLNTY